MTSPKNVMQAKSTFFKGSDMPPPEVLPDCTAPQLTFTHQNNTSKTSNSDVACMYLRTGIFFLWTFVLIGWPQDIFQSLQVARPALVLGIMTLILIVLVPTRGAVAEAFQSPEGRKYVLLYLIMIVGIPFAYHKRVAFEYTILSYGVNVLYFMACALIVDSVAKLRALMFVMVAATCWYGVVGLAEGVHSDGRLFMV